MIGADGTGERRLADTGGWPVWWPDGRKVGLIAIGADGNQEIRVVPLDGGSPSTLGHLRFTGVNYPFDVSRDGTRLVTSNGTHVSDEIWLLEPKK